MFVGPTVPSVRANVHDLCNLVEEVGEVRLEYLCVICKLIDLAYHEDSCDFLARDHDL